MSAKNLIDAQAALGFVIAQTSIIEPGIYRTVYRKDPSVLKLHMPMPHRFLPAYQAGPLRWEIPGVMRLGGLDVRLPKEVSYIDGL